MAFEISGVLVSLRSASFVRTRVSKNTLRLNRRVGKVKTDPRNQQGEAVDIALKIFVRQLALHPE